MGLIAAYPKLDLIPRPHIDDKVVPMVSASLVNAAV